MKVTINRINSQDLYISSIHLDDNKIAWIVGAPHNNCQIYSIASFETLMSYGVAEVTNVLKEIYQTGNNKPLLSLDIHTKDDYHKMVVNIFKEENIVFKQDYTSTNGSKMSMYLINTKEITK